MCSVLCCVYRCICLYRYYSYLIMQEADFLNSIGNGKIKFIEKLWFLSLYGMWYRNSQTNSAFIYLIIFFYYLKIKLSRFLYFASELPIFYNRILFLKSIYQRIIRSWTKHISYCIAENTSETLALLFVVQSMYTKWH